MLEGERTLTVSGRLEEGADELCFRERKSHGVGGERSDGDNDDDDGNGNGGAGARAGEADRRTGEGRGGQVNEPRGEDSREYGMLSTASRDASKAGPAQDGERGCPLGMPRRGGCDWRRRTKGTLSRASWVRTAIRGPDPSWVERTVTGFALAAMAPAFCATPPVVSDATLCCTQPVVAFPNARHLTAKCNVSRPRFANMSIMSQTSSMILPPGRAYITHFDAPPRSIRHAAPPPHASPER